MSARTTEKTKSPVAGESQPDALAASEARAAKLPPDANGKAANGASAGAGAPPAPAKGPGLDDAHHRQAQRTAQQADNLARGVFPAFMSCALGLEKFFAVPGYQLYLEQTLAACGDPTDPIERMMVEQLCLLHFRIGQVHVGAGQAKNSEVEKHYNGAAARLMGEFRRSALALHILRGRAPQAEPGANLAPRKAAQ